MRRETPTGGTNRGTADASRDSTDGLSGNRELSPWDRAELLSSRRRRVVLDVLADRNSPVTLRILAAEVASREGDARRIDGESERRVAITLHHVHLPKLAERGVVDYDPDLKLVESVAVGHLVA